MIRICQVGRAVSGLVLYLGIPHRGVGMRHFPRLNRVAYGILRRRHPTVLTLLEQKTAGFRRDLGRRAPPVGYCASVSPNLRCVSANVRQTAASVSDNVRRKWPSIARRTVHYCAPLHLPAPRRNDDDPERLALRLRSLRHTISNHDASPRDEIKCFRRCPLPGASQIRHTNRHSIFPHWNSGSDPGRTRLI